MTEDVQAIGSERKNKYHMTTCGVKSGSLKIEIGKARRHRGGRSFDDRRPVGRDTEGQAEGRSAVPERAYSNGRSSPSLPQHRRLYIQRISGQHHTPTFVDGVWY
ncbi:unnamed protein product [Soboliphyme baturini]|uniref:Uncharacterized protein n=1 Tax=Soboliphyme baturini TaxID=241478 RepID=A0A183IB12_9BILA|nr:unnamed protein product [Soboliphyme baturini]